MYQSTIVFTKTSFNHGNNQTERKNHLVQQRRHKHKDGFQEPYGQEFSRSGIYRLYPAHRNQGYGILARHHRALQGRRSGRQRNNPECMKSIESENPMKLRLHRSFICQTFAMLRNVQQRKLRLSPFEQHGVPFPLIVTESDILPVDVPVTRLQLSD